MGVGDARDEGEERDETSVDGQEEKPVVVNGDVGADADSTSPPAAASPEPSGQDKERMNRLRFLLEKSSIYSKILGDKMQKQMQEAADRDAREQEETGQDKAVETVTAASASPGNGRTTRTASKHGDPKVAADSATTSPIQKRGQKRKAEGRGSKTSRRNDKGDYKIQDYVKPDDLAHASEKPAHGGDEREDQATMRQPKLVSGAVMRQYQLQGLQWLVSLYENGLNGILADEMGLGKTIQTIAFLAHLRSKGVWGPYLIAGPLSVIGNWITEFNRFTPSIPVILYHGLPKERAEMRRKYFSRPDPETFPVIVTSYELVMNDRKFLSHLQWKYIVVDEGHRLKNLNCKLIRELKSYTSANRLLLSGTPLQNNLNELWSLLNFLLPDIFSDLDSFQKWFDFSELNSDDPSAASKIISREQSEKIVSNLHQILKPFLLRRVKSDVEENLPKKREYVLYAPLTAQQKEIYDAIVNRTLREVLIDKRMKSNGNLGKSEESDDGMVEVASDTSGTSTPQRRSKRGSKSTPHPDYNENGSDSKWLKGLLDQDGDDSLPASGTSTPNKRAQAESSLSKVTLRNIVMQLRKCCNHPFQVDWPYDDNDVLDTSENLITTSGKMMLLDRLLESLFDQNHRVLLFSQFTTMLDIIEAYADYRGWQTSRIDGATDRESRLDQMKSFNEDKSKKAVKLFLLSTKAGGLGVNLVGADTVILFDSDWNPQNDLQAMARAHRIGQTNPVLIFRLVSANTVESRIIQKASSKRKLERLVIDPGKFRAPSQAETAALLGKRHASTTGVKEIADILLQEDTESIRLVGKGDEIINDEELARLLDRSDEALDRQDVWQSSQGNVSAEIINTIDDHEEASLLDVAAAA